MALSLPSSSNTADDEKMGVPHLDVVQVFRRVFALFFSPVGHASSPAENWLRITEEGHKKTDQNRQHWNDKLKSLFCDSQLDTPFVCFVIFAWERETWTRAHAQLTQSVMQLKNFNLPDQT